MSRFKDSKLVPRAGFAQSAVRVLAPVPITAPRPSVTPSAPRPSQGETAGQFSTTRQILSQSDLDNPFRKLGFYFAIAFVFCRFSLLGELVALTLNFDPHIVRILGIPAVVLTVLSGGLGRVLRSKLSYGWLGLVICMGLAAPLSYWPGGSIPAVVSYLFAQVPMLLIVGGLVLTWKECRQILIAVALAGGVNVLSGKFFVSNPDNESRFSLELGTIGNANDFTAHLLFVLPIVLFVLFTSPRKWIRRILCIGTLVSGVYFCAATGSRGGLIAFAAAFAFVLVRAPGRVRIGALAAAAAIFVVVLAVLPQSLLQRYATLFTNDTNDVEAVESTAARTHLLMASIRFTFEHPLLGVGPAEFSDYEASVAKSEGTKAGWQVTHNAYTQISSEEGLPALLFYLTSIVLTFRTFGRLYRAARARPKLRSMATACFCCQLAMVGFCTAIFFLSLALTMYLPTMSGLAIAFSRALEGELAAQS